MHTPVEKLLRREFDEWNLFFCQRFMVKQQQLYSRGSQSPNKLFNNSRAGLLLHWNVQTACAKAVGTYSSGAESIHVNMTSFIPCFTSLFWRIGNWKGDVVVVCHWNLLLASFVWPATVRWGWQDGFCQPQNDIAYCLFYLQCNNVQHE